MQGRHIQDFTKLQVWQRAERLAADIYLATKDSPWARHPGLRGQLRDAAGSIGANIAEGSRAGTRPQFARFLGYSIGSASETQSHLSLAARLGFLDPEAHHKLADETIQLVRMLIALQRKVRQGTVGGT